MGKAISQLPDALAASAITNAGNIWLGVDNTGDGTSYKMKLSELQKVAVGAFVDVRAHGATGDGVTDDTAAIQAAIDAAGESSAVYFPPGKYIVSSQITFDPNGSYYTDLSSRLRYGKSETYIESSLAGATAAFLIKGTAGTTYGYGPRFDNLSFFRANADGTCFQVHDIQRGTWNHVSFFGGDVCLEVLGDVIGSWQNSFDHCLIYGPNSSNSVTGCVLDSTGTGVGANENWFDRCLFIGNDKSLVINDADHVSFSQCEFAKAYATGGAGTGTIEIGVEGNYAEFHACRFEQNNADAAAYLIKCEADYLKILGGKCVSSTMSSTNYLSNTGGNAHIFGCTNLANTINGEAMPVVPAGGGLRDQGMTFASRQIETLNSTTLTPTSDLVQLTFDGNNLDNITATNRLGMSLQILAGGAGTVRDTSTSGGNLRLDSSADYAMGTTDTLILTCNGTNWYEQSRGRNASSAPVGSCVVVHADGTTQTFAPATDTRAGRGAALSSALSALVTQTAVDLPGSTLYLYPGADYEGTDLTVTSKDGVRIIGQDNVIWNTPSTAYDHILLFSLCDDVLLKGVTVQGDGDLSNGADPSTVTNTGNGAGIRFTSCARPRVVDCGAHGMTGRAGAPFPYNGYAHGIWFNNCDDIYVNGFTSNYAGNVGFQIEGDSDRAVCENIHIYNARNRSAQFSPTAACDILTLRNCTFLSDETVNTLSTDTDWFSYIPYFNVGTTGFALDTIHLENVHHYWVNPSASQTAAGSGFPLLKLQEVRHTYMTNCVLYHGAAFSPGTGSPNTFSMLWQNAFPGDAYINDCYFSLDLRNFGGTTYPMNLYVTNSRFGQDQSHATTFYQFGTTKSVFQNCDFAGWTAGVFDFDRDITGELHAIDCTFHGSATTDTVVKDPITGNANAIDTWSGNYLFYNNTYDTCRPASSADDRLVLNQATGNKLEIVWDDSLAGDLAHPSPGSSPGVFSTVGGQAGMKIRNKNYSPNATSTWAAEYAWWSTSSGAWQDS